MIKDSEKRMKNKYYIEKEKINWKSFVLLGGTFLWIMLSETTPVPLSSIYLVFSFFMFYIFVDELDENGWKKKYKAYVKPEKVIKR